MARKKKNNENNGVYTIKLEKNLPNSPISKRSSGGWVTWGRRNDWPSQMLGLYASSPTLAACCNFFVKALVGGGIDYTAMGLDGSQLRPNYKYSWDELLRRVSLAYAILGNFALQIIKNKDGKTYSIYHQPMETVRSELTASSATVRATTTVPGDMATNTRIPGTSTAVSA